MNLTFFWGRACLPFKGLGIAFDWLNFVCHKQVMYPHKLNSFFIIRPNIESFLCTFAALC
jgi:hypothetical protein